jgi:predicted HTH transcriptional regulator
LTEDELRQLLYGRESETLDFKRDQYPFVRSTDEQKAELLKELMAFANARRSSPACILIGVEESPQPRGARHAGEHALADNRRSGSAEGEPGVRL